MSLKDKLLKVRDYFIEAPSGSSTPPPATDVLPTPTPTIPLPPKRGTATAATEDTDRTIYDDLPEAPGGAGNTGSAAPASGYPLPPMSDEAVLAAMTGPRTVGQIVQASEGPNLEDIKVSFEGDAPLPVRPDGSVDFPAIYAQAGLPAPPFGAEQMIGMLADLPEEMPLEMRRRTVRVAIAAMGRHIGATPENIAADASRKLAALAAFVDESDRHTAEMTSATEAEIAALQAQIEEKQQSIAQAQRRRESIHRACESEADRLDDVTAFFAAEIGMPDHLDPLAPPATAPLTPDTSNTWEQAPSIEVEPDSPPSRKR